MDRSNGIALVIFDMDGTLTVPHLDFAHIRKVLGVPRNDMLVLDYILSLEGEAQQQAMQTMQDFEDEAAYSAELQPGARKLLDELHRRGIRIALQTRNSRRSVDIVFAEHGIEIDDIFTRENAEPKPDPVAALSLLKKYGVNGHNAVFVGDFWLDIETGFNAGMRTVLIRNGEPFAERDHIRPDAKIDNLLDLMPLIEKWSDA